MNATDSPPAKCPQCGNSLPSGFAGRTCPSCLLLGVAGISLGVTTRLDGLTVVSSEAPGGYRSAGQHDVIGPYRLVEQLGEGGFGIVWRAEQTEPIRREVALKVIKPGMDSREVIARFEAERQALAMMDHPNIAVVLDAGTTDTGHPYFVMELVRGQHITTYCDERRLTIKQRLELFIPVCQAVQHAHQKAILHRDLKPSNILMMEVDGKPVAKVIDFGIAKALGAAQDILPGGNLAQTLEGMLLGTPQYMSPEQAGSVPDVDTRSDIYTLGVILYELLTGRSPMDVLRLRKAAVDEICRIIREEEPAKPSTKIAKLDEATASEVAQQHGTETIRRWTHEVRGELDWIVMMALEKERERRYQTASDLSADLERYLKQEPVKAGPPARGYKALMFIKRNRMMVGAISTVLLSLLLGLTASLWQNGLANRARIEAEMERDAKQVAVLKQQELLSSASRQFHSSASELVSMEDAPRAVAHLVEALRLDTGNTSAAAFLGNLLAWRSNDLYRMPDDRWEPYKEFEPLSGRDGKLIAMSGSEGKGDVFLRILSLDKFGAIGDEIRFKGHQSRSAGVSNNGAKVLLGAEFCHNSSFFVTRRGTLRLQSDMRVGPEGKMIIEVWDSNTGNRVAEPCEVTSSPTHQVFVSNEGRRLAYVFQSGPQQTKLELFNLEGTCKLIGSREIPSTLARASIRNSRTEHENGRGSGDHLVCSGFGGNPLRLLIATSNREQSLLNFIDADTGGIVGSEIVVKGRVRSTEFTADGKHLVIGCEHKDGTAQSAAVLDVQKAGPVMINISDTTPLCISENGKQMLCSRGSSGAQHIELFSLVDCVSTSTSISLDGSIYQTALSPDGQTVAVATSSSVILWNSKKNEKRAMQLAHDGFVGAVAFSSDGIFLHTLCSVNGRLRLWRVRDGSLISDHIMQGQVEDIIAAGSQSVAVRLKGGGWAAFANQTPAALPLKLSIEGKMKSLKGENSGPEVRAGQACEGVWHPSGDSLAVTPGIFYDRTFFAGLWETASLKCKLLVNTSPVSGATEPPAWSANLAYSHDGRHFVAARDGSGAFIWDTATGNMKGPPIVAPAASAAFLPDGQSFLCFDRYGAAQHFGLDGSKMLTPKELKLGFGTKPNDASGIEGMGYFGSNGSVFWWHQGDARNLWSKWGGGIFSPDGGVLLGPWHSSRSAPVTDFKTSKVLGNLKQPAVIEDACFSPDGRLVATAGFDGVARLFQIPECKAIGVGLDQGGDMRGVEFDASGKILLTRVPSRPGLHGGSTQIWSVAAAKPITPKLRQDASSARIQPQGRWLLTTADNSGYLWGLILPSEARVPAWVPDFATWASGVRLRADGGVDLLTWQERKLLRARLDNVPRIGGRWEELLSWSLSPTSNVTVQPFHPMKTGEIMEAWLRGDQDTALSLDDAYERALEHPLAQLAVAARSQDKSYSARLRTIAVSRLPESARQWGGKSAADWCREVARICRVQNDESAARLAEAAIPPH
jgi:serine/threonine protein kinase/WD40 repeat protein